MKIIRILSSLKLTVTLFFILIVLVALMTIAQEHMGTYQAIKIYLTPWFITYPSSIGNIPYFFGGRIVGLFLSLNLLAAYVLRFRFTWNKIGIHFIHLGTFVLIAGMTTSAFFVKEGQIQLFEGSSTRYSTRIRTYELVIAKTDAPNIDTVTTIDEPLLKPGQLIYTEALPFQVTIKKHLKNARLSWRQDPSYQLSDVGVGPFLNVFPMPEELKDDKENTHVVYVTLHHGGKELGTWLLSNLLKEPQEVQLDNATYALSLRQKRDYYPYNIKLITFTHERYPNSDIPKSFASEIEITDLAGHILCKETISMNSPLRFDGHTFYQSGFGGMDQVSIIHVVKNPIRTFPYVCTVLISFGLLIQLLLRRRVR